MSPVKRDTASAERSDSKARRGGALRQAIARRRLEEYREAKQLHQCIFDVLAEENGSLST